MSFDSVGDGLHGLLARWVQDSGAREAIVKDAWKRAAGPAVVEHTTILGLTEATLRVRIDDPRWERPLRGMEARLLRRLGEMLGAGVVRGLDWVPSGNDPTHR